MKKILLFWLVFRLQNYNDFFDCPPFNFSIDILNGKRMYETISDKTLYPLRMKKI